MSKRRPRVPGIRKRGTGFEQVVAEVVKAMEPTHAVEQGTWVEGPDGRRELDVVITVEVDAQNRTVLIECKDFAPGRTVGIEYVDALDSKRQDLGVDVTLLCCNAGFTAPAILKAARVDIGLIGVMREGDSRIRVSISQALYTREVKVEQLSVELRHDGHPHDLGSVSGESLLFEGLPLVGWVSKHLAMVIAANPVVNGAFGESFKLKDTIVVERAGEPIAVDELIIGVTITGAWYEQEVTYNASAGLYDWLRHRVRLAPGQSQLHIEGVGIPGGTLVEQPPDHVLKRGDLRPGEMTLGFVHVTGLPWSTETEVPDLDRHVDPDDFDPLIEDLPPETIRSAPPGDSRGELGSVLNAPARVTFTHQESTG